MIIRQGNLMNKRLANSTKLIDKIGIVKSVYF